MDPAVYFMKENPRFGKIYAETHEFWAFPENALIDPQLNMTKGSTFSFFHAIRTNWHYPKTINLHLTPFKTI